MKVFIINGKGACVDCDTEYFNGTEWKKIADYQEGDKVLQYNVDGTAELVYPNVYIENYQDKLNLFQNSFLDICVSDEHECYYVTSKNNLYHKSFKELKQDFNNSKNGTNARFITGFNYKGGNGLNLTDSEIKLMIAIIADSHIRNYNTGYCFLNLKKEYKKEEFRNICKEGNIPYTEKQYNSMPGYSRFFVHAPIPEKYFSKIWYNCNKHQLELIADNILKWDGNRKNEFYTNNKESADFIQFVFTALGKSANIHIFDRRGTKHYKTIEYCVSVSNRTLHALNNDSRHPFRSICDYTTIDGKSYCFNVPSHMWVCRRNNKIHITGNSGKDEFVNQLEQLTSVYRHSTIDTIKGIAEAHFGWDGEKDAKGRKLLSDLKIASIEYNDMPHNEMKIAIDYAEQSGQYDIFTCMIRDIPEIEKAVNDPDLRDKIVTILITSDRTKNNTYGNVADDNVLNYVYDYYLDNSGTIDDLKEMARLLLIDLGVLKK